MSHIHYYQEDTDKGLKIAALLLQLIQGPSSLSKSEWHFLNTLPIGTLMAEGGMSRKEAVHVCNQIDRIEADVSKFGRFEHLTDAFMMWLVGASFILAGVLLALLAVPETVWGRVTIPVSMGIGILFIFIPVLARKRALSYDKDCFTKTIIEILGTGLMKRSVLTTDALIRELNSQDPSKVLLSVIDKFASVQNHKISRYEEVCLVKQLLDGYKMTIADLPFKVVEEIEVG